MPDRAGITPQIPAHLFAIFARLEAKEQEFARQVVNDLSDAERARWIRELSTMSVDDAVTLFRKKMEGVS